MDLFTTLRRFLVLEFPSWGADKGRRLALSQLMKKLERKKDHLYEPLADQFTPAFGEVIGRLTVLVGPWAQVFRPWALLTPSARTSLEAALVSRQLDARGEPLDTFTFASLQAAYGAGPGGDVRPIDQAFDRKMAAFRQGRLTEYARGYRSVQALSALVLMDYSPWLGRLRSKKAPGTWTSASVVPLREALLDLLYLLPAIRLDDMAAQVLRDLETLVGEGTPGRDLAGLKALLAGPLHPDFLTDLVRSSLEDPAYTPRFGTAEGDLLAPTLAQINEAYRAARQEFVRGQAETDFQAQVHDLFGDAVLEPVTGYDQVTSLILDQVGLPEYRSIRPLLLLKNFYGLMFRPQVRVALGDFFLEADFSDNAFKTSLVKTVDALDEFGDRLGPFEEDAGLFFLSRVKPLLPLLENNLIEKSVKEKTKHEIEVMNQNADVMVQGILTNLSRLTDLLAEVVWELGSRESKHLRNGRELSIRKASLKNELLKSAEVLTHAYRVLKHLTVDVGAAKRYLAESEIEAAAES